jgi:hypothetical protein
VDKKWIAMAAGACVLTAGLMAAANARAPKIVDPIDPANFDTPVANPYFPLVVGQLAVLKGQEDGNPLVNRVKVTSDTKVIHGVTTTVVFDRVWEDGALAERTYDWYASDNDGNVWYFGEDTATLDGHGHVTSTAGSWEAGVDGAVAGIIMPADPRPTDAFRQEYLKGEAEDQAWITQRFAQRTVPYGHLTDLVRSYEWTRLEPGVVARKFFAPGIGIVAEQDVAGGTESLELVSFTPRA